MISRHVGQGMPAGALLCATGGNCGGGGNRTRAENSRKVGGCGKLPATRNRPAAQVAANAPKAVAA